MSKRKADKRKNPEYDEPVSVYEEGQTPEDVVRKMLEVTKTSYVVRAEFDDRESLTMEFATPRPKLSVGDVVNFPIAEDGQNSEGAGWTWQIVALEDDGKTLVVRRAAQG